MMTRSKQDLFSVPTRKERQMSGREADEALIRARNAALQQPIGYLQSGRNVFVKNDVPLFAHANPVQAAQFLLSQISHNMVFATPVSMIEMSYELASHIRMLAGEDRMTVELSEAAAEKVIDTLRNKHGDYQKFTETFRNPATLEEVEYSFSLLAVDTVRDGNEEINVFRLTREGVKLLHVSWNPDEDFNMISLIVANLVKHGKYTEAYSHVVQCRDRSVEIESQIGDILRALNQFSFQPDFQKEMSDLISAVQQQTTSFTNTYSDFSKLFETAATASLDPEQEHEIALIRIELRHIHDIQSRLSYMVSDCVKKQMALIANRMESSTVSASIPDIQQDFLRGFAGLTIEMIAETGLAEQIATPLLGPKIDRMLDMFLFIDDVKVDDGSRDDMEEDDEVVAVPRKSTAYSIEDNAKANVIIRAALKTYGERGLSLSLLHDLVEGKDLPLSLRQCVIHRLALLPSNFDGRPVEKSWDGSAMIDSKYLTGPDLTYRFAGVA